MHELPLVFFTVLGQTSVGLLLLSYLSQRLKLISVQQLAYANLAALILMGLGFLVGMFHLGQLLRSVNMIFGAGRSPMSNEILVNGLFVGLLVVTLFFSFIKKNSTLANGFNLLTLVAGVFFVFAITRVYQIETIATWNTQHTSLQMWLTMFVAGGAIAMVMGSRKVGAIAFLIAACVSIVSKPFYLGFLYETAAQLASEQTIFWAIQLFCLGLGVMAATLALVRQEKITRFLVSAALLIIVGELAGRIAFYNLWAIPM